MEYNASASPAPAPGVCQICSSTPTNAAVAFYSFGRKILQSSTAIQIPCCVTPTPELSFCSTPKCTLYLVTGLLAVLIGGLFLALTVAFVKMRMNRRLGIVNSNMPLPPIPVASISARRPYRALEVSTPAPAEFQACNCPVCWEDVSEASNWRVFACKHGTCARCHQGLITPPGAHSACPLCRSPLAVPEATGTAGEIQSQPSLTTAQPRAADSELEARSSSQTALHMGQFPSESPMADTSGSQNVETVDGRQSSVASIPIFAFAGISPEVSTPQNDHHTAEVK